jgi:anti-anti-sigma factor
MSMQGSSYPIVSGVVTPEGELDVAHEHELAQRLKTAIDASPRVVLDLSLVTFLDSTILSVILQAHRAAESRGGRLTIVGASPRAERLFQLTQLDQVLHMPAGRSA